MRLHAGIGYALPTSGCELRTIRGDLLCRWRWGGTFMPKVSASMPIAARYPAAAAAAVATHIRRAFTSAKVREEVCYLHHGLSKQLPGAIISPVPVITGDNHINRKVSHFKDKIFVPFRLRSLSFDARSRFLAITVSHDQIREITLCWCFPAWRRENFRFFCLNL